MADIAESMTTNVYERRLRWVMLIYLIGLLSCLLFIGILEQIGVSNYVLGQCFFILPLVGYAIVGMASRPSHLSDYYVAGRRVPALYNGMATAADWMSAAAFVGMAGSLFLLGYDGLAFILGWTAGFVLLAVLIVPYLRRSGAITVPEFLADRYESRSMRLLCIVIVLAASFAYLVAQMFAAALITSRFFGVDFTLSVYINLLIALACTVHGGMRAVTWTQVAQCVVLVIAYVTPLVILSVKKYGIPIPQLTYGQALQDISNLEQNMLANGLASASSMKSYVTPFLSYSPTNFIALAATMMVGTAVMPHVLTRYVTTPTVRDARTSVVWTLFFILILYLSAPAYAAFAKLDWYAGTIGRPLSDLPPWVFSYGKLGLVKICGVNADSIDAIKVACSKIAAHPGLLRHQDLVLNTDVIVTALPEATGLPYIVAGLMGAGALAAAISTANGLLITMSTALSHDLYYRIIDNSAKPSRRLLVTRVMVIAIAALAAVQADSRPADLLAMVAWAFSLAASGLFAALVLGIWWRPANTVGAISGMITGFGVCLLYLMATRYFPGFGVKYLGMWSLYHPTAGTPIVDVARAMAAPNAMDGWVTFAHPLAGKIGWFGINNISAAIFGVPAAFLVTIAISKLTGSPSPSAQEYVESIRSPDAEAMFVDGAQERANFK